MINESQNRRITTTSTTQGIKNQQSGVSFILLVLLVGIFLIGLIAGGSYYLASSSKTSSQESKTQNILDTSPNQRQYTEEERNQVIKDFFRKFLSSRSTDQALDAFFDMGSYMEEYQRVVFTRESEKADRKYEEMKKKSEAEFEEAAERARKEDEEKAALENAEFEQRFASQSAEFQQQFEREKETIEKERETPLRLPSIGAQ